MDIYRRWMICGSGLMACGCAYKSTTQGSLSGVERGQLMMGKAETHHRQAEYYYAQIINSARRKDALNRDAALYARVKKITDRLIDHVHVFRPESKAWKWEVNVIHQADVNAWCMAGGKMAIYTGIINRLSMTDDEIAMVMGHEIAHALREHQQESQTRTGIANALGTALSAAARTSNSAAAGAQRFGDTVKNVLMPFSRIQEKEADRIGAELGARAGYNPIAAEAIWRKMARAFGDGKNDEYGGTHPAAERRADELAQLAKTLHPLFEQAQKRL